MKWWPDRAANHPKTLLTNIYTHMALDWIKLEVATPDKPEVFLLAEILHLDPDAALGKLVRLWTWLDQNAASPIVRVSAAHIDRLVNQPGFVKAMVKVGWMQIGRGQLAGHLCILNFEKHLSKNAKTRGGNMNRNRDFRQRQKEKREAEEAAKNAKNQGSNGENRDVSAVTEASPEKWSGENRKEENTLSPAGGEQPLHPSDELSGVEKGSLSLSSQTQKPPQAFPTLEQALALGESQGIPAETVTLWWHARQAIGWKLHGRVPIKCWISDLTGYHLTYVRNHPLAAAVPAPSAAISSGVAVKVADAVNSSRGIPPVELIAEAWVALGGKPGAAPPWMLLRERVTELRQVCPALDAWFQGRAAAPAR